MLFYRIISYVFHPLLFSFIGTFLYLVLTPIHMAKKQEYLILSIVFISTYILPVFLLMFLKKIKMIESYHLKQVEERKFPILFFILLSILLGKMLLNIKIANVLAYSFFAIAIALSAAYLFLFLRIKTSLHTLGIGGVLGFILILSLHYQMNFNWILALLFIISGLIAVSRLKLEAHTPKEVYLGFLLGVIAQFISFQFYQSI